MTNLNSAYYNAIDLTKLQMVYPNEFMVYKKLVDSNSSIEQEYGVIEGVLENPINEALWNNQIYLYYKDLAEKELRNLLVLVES